MTTAHYLRCAINGNGKHVWALRGYTIRSAPPMPVEIAVQWRCKVCHLEVVEERDYRVGDEEGHFKPEHIFNIDGSPAIWA